MKYSYFHRKLNHNISTGALSIHTSEMYRNSCNKSQKAFVSCCEAL